MLMYRRAPANQAIIENNTGNVTVIRRIRQFTILYCRAYRFGITEVKKGYLEGVHTYPNTKYK